ncbi:MAG: hypothetical protein M1324_02025 [Patescibacteria group bacterium]|nr:hypothetical protein [Patescibacteria group bacterium]
MRFDGMMAFFGSSMRGGQAIVSRDELVQLKDAIRELGIKFVSEHQTQAGIIAKEDELSPVNIHDRDWENGQRSRIGIFEVSNPSLGVGAEISDLLHMGIPVICLYHQRIDEKAVSAYIRGKEGSMYVSAPFECCEYADTEHVRDLVREFAMRHVSG